MKNLTPKTPVSSCFALSQFLFRDVGSFRNSLGSNVRSKLGQLGLCLALPLAGLVPLVATGADAAEPVQDAPKAGDKAPKNKKKAGPTFKLDLSKSTAEIKVNGEGILSIQILPEDGAKVHPKAPLEVKLSTGATLKLQKPKLGRKDVVDKEAPAPEITTTIYGVSPGAGTIDAEVTFFLCTDTECQRKKQKVSFAVKTLE